MQVQGIESSSSSSLPLVNESLESLIHDLQELSQPEIEVFNQPQRDVIVRNNNETNVEAGNNCSLGSAEIMEYEISSSKDFYVYEPAENLTISSMNNMSCEIQTAVVEKHNVPVEKDFSEVGESLVGMRNVTQKDRYVCKGIKALPPYSSVAVCKHRAETDMRMLVESIVLKGSSDNVASELLLTKLEKKAIDSTVIEMDKDLGEEQMPPAESKLEVRSPKLLLNKKEDTVVGSSVTEPEENMGGMSILPQYYSEVKSPKVLLILSEEKVLSSSMAEPEENLGEKIMLVEERILSLPNSDVKSSEVLLIISEEKVLSSSAVEPEEVMGKEKMSNPNDESLKVLLSDPDEKVLSSAVIKLEENIGEKQIMPQSNPKGETPIFLCILSEEKVLTAVEPEENLDEEKMPPQSSSQGKHDALECMDLIPKTFECEVCCTKFAKLTNFRRHISYHTGVFVFCCDQCDLTFESDNDLVSHNIKLHKYPSEFICDVCNFELATHPEFEEHIGSHFGKEPFSCGECHSKFKMYSDFCLHSHQHTAEVLHKCVMCPSLFRCESDLHSHANKVHTGDRHPDTENTKVPGEENEVKILNVIHKCETCEKCFRNAKGLRMHIVSVHRTKEKKVKLERKRPLFECGECGIKFNTAAVYSRHLSTHQVKARRCNLKAKLNIKLTSLTFKKEKFVCSVCLKTFNGAIHLKRHMSSKHVCESKQLLSSERVKKTGYKTVSTLPISPDRKSLSRSLQHSRSKLVKRKDKLFDNNNNSRNNNPDDLMLMVCNNHVTFGNNTSKDPHEGTALKSTTDSITGMSNDYYSCSNCLVSFHSLSDLIQHKQLDPMALICLKCIDAFSVDSSGFDPELCKHFN